MNRASLHLDRLTDEQKEKALEWRNSPSIYKWCRQVSPVSPAHHRDYWARVDADKSVDMFSIIDSKEEQFVGVCGLTSIDYVNRRAEFSLYIGPQYQGMGYGEEALRLLCRHGFARLNLHSIWGEVFDGNPAMKVFRRLGFVEEGRRRDFYFRDGKYIDAILISLLRAEFK